MNQWVEKKGDKWYWFQQYSKAELILLKKYHTAINRMTKLDYSRIIK